MLLRLGATVVLLAVFFSRNPCEAVRFDSATLLVEDDCVLLVLTNGLSASLKTEEVAVVVLVLDAFWGFTIDTGEGFTLDDLLLTAGLVSCTAGLVVLPRLDLDTTAIFGNGFGIVRWGTEGSGGCGAVGAVPAPRRPGVLDGCL